MTDTIIGQIPEVPAAQWTESVREVFASLEGPAARENGSAFNIIKVMANSPGLSLPYLEFSKYLLGRSTVPIRLRELLIMRALWQSKGRYEWAHHCNMAARIGMTAEDIAAIKTGSNAAVWNAEEQLVLTIADRAAAAVPLTDADWAALRQHFDPAQQLDLLFMAGCYPMMAWIQNSLDLQLEPGLTTDLP